MATLRFIENLKAHRGCLIEILRDVYDSDNDVLIDISGKSCVLINIEHLDNLKGEIEGDRIPVYRTTGKNSQGQIPHFASHNSAVIYVLVDGSIMEIKVHHSDIRRLTDN